MTYFEFSQLCEMDKLKAVWQYGVLVAQRREGHYDYELYQFDNFYVEQQIHIQWNIRKTFRTFVTTACLSPYLDKIDISELISE